MPPASGERLLHYRLVEKIGQGGMGSVWRAEDTTLDRDAAIKILPDAFAADGQFLARFEREAKVLASLSHPNLAMVFGVHESDGTRFLAMELVPGEDLSQRLQRGPLTLAEAVAILVPIADALEAAHAKGVIHRDLKPANVRLTSDGRVKVLDFGLAKTVETDGSSPDLTATGVVLGTAPYMSPEQARGQAVDARTDVWAFGCVLWECLTSARPFAGDTVPDLVATILNEEPDWTKLPNDTPPSIRRLLRRCLRKAPRDRLHHIADARIELEDAEPDPVPHVPDRARLLIPVLGLALAGALAFAFTRGGGGRTVEAGALASARFTKLTSYPGDEVAAVISPAGDTVAFVSNHEGSFVTYYGRIGSGRYHNLSAVNPDATVGGVKEMIRLLGFKGDGAGIWTSKGPLEKPLDLIPLPAGPTKKWLVDSVLHVDWSPDRQRIVYSLAVKGDTVFVADANGANAEPILTSPDGYHQHFPTWSPDGKWIYIARGYTTTGEMDLYRTRPDGGDLEQLTTEQRNVAYPTPVDARTVLFVAEEWDGSGPWLWELDVETRAPPRRAARGVEQYLSLAGSRDGRRLVATVANPRIGLWVVPIPPPGTEATEGDAKPHPLEAVRAHAPRIRGDDLYFLSSQGGRDGLWRRRGGETAEEVWTGRTPLLEPAAVSPDGDEVALVVRDSGRPRLMVIAADGTRPRLLLEDVDVAGAACWSPDGSEIAVGGSRQGTKGLFRVRVADGWSERIVGVEATNPAWSPDGKTIVFAGKLSVAFTGLRAVTPDGRAVELPRKISPSGGPRFQFLPDGSGLVYMEGRTPNFDFHLVDLETGASRQLTRLEHAAHISAFAITPDGRSIVFDRQYDNSDIVLIERD